MISDHAKGPSIHAGETCFVMYRYTAWYKVALRLAFSISSQLQIAKTIVKTLTKMALTNLEKSVLEPVKQQIESEFADWALKIDLPERHTMSEKLRRLHRAITDYEEGKLCALGLFNHLEYTRRCDMFYPIMNYLPPALGKLIKDYQSNAGQQTPQSVRRVKSIRVVQSDGKRLVFFCDV